MSPARSDGRPEDCSLRNADDRSGATGEATRRRPLQTFDDRRRRFVTHLVLAGAGAAIVGGWSTGCAPGGPSADEVAREAKSYDPDLDCTDTSDLYEAQKSIREENEYVAVSNHPTQRCFNCTFYQPAEQRSSCGTCETVPGPIHPLGRCKAWVYRR